MSDNHDLHDEALSRLYKMGDGIDPPPHIDAEIKQAARDATANKKRGLAWPSLASAAVLVLSLTLILKVLDQEPLETSIMEPMQADDQATAPMVMQQEIDKDEQLLKRYAAKKRRIAPAPAKNELQESIQLDVAPAAAISRMTASNTQQLNCSGTIMPKTDHKDEWVRQYQKALGVGQIVTARCLQQGYLAKFNQAMSIPSKQ